MRDTIKMQKLQEADYAPPVKWDMVESIEGIMRENKVVRIGEFDRKVIVIEDKDGNRHSIWQSAALRPMFNLPVGVYLKIEFKGWETNSKTGRRFRKFLVTFDPETIKEVF